MRYRIQYQNTDIEIPPGSFVVGRSAECQLVLDDPLVSRRHVAFRAEPDRLIIEDLGSRNGVAVNGATLTGTQVLSDNDVITIGGQDFRVSIVPLRSSGESIAPATRRENATTLTFEERTIAGPPLLVQVFDKALAMGRLDEAERILGNLLADVRGAITRGEPNTAGMLEHAARCAIRVASATGHATWIDWIFEAYDAAGRVMPTTMVDELHTLVRKVRYGLGPPLRAYLDALRERSSKLNASERFAVQRLEGLVRVLKSQ